MTTDYFAGDLNADQRIAAAALAHYEQGVTQRIAETKARVNKKKFRPLKGMFTEAPHLLRSVHKGDITLAEAKERFASDSANGKQPQGQADSVAETPAGGEATAAEDADRLAKMERHELSALTRDLSERVKEKLREEVGELGIGEREIDVFQNRILDGWHRVEACRSAGMLHLLRIKEFKGTYEQALGYVLSKQFRRKNPTKGQCASIGHQLSKDSAPGRPPENCLKIGSYTQEQAAEAVGVSRAAIQQFAAIIKEWPELAEKVASPDEDGKPTLGAAYGDANKLKKLKKADADLADSVRKNPEALKDEYAKVIAAERMDELRDEAPGLAAKVEAEELTLEEAWKKHKAGDESLTEAQPNSPQQGSSPTQTAPDPKAEQAEVEAAKRERDAANARAEQAETRIETLQQQLNEANNDGKDESEPADKAEPTEEPEAQQQTAGQNEGGKSLSANEPNPNILDSARVQEMRDRLEKHYLREALHELDADKLKEIDERMDDMTIFGVQKALEDLD